MDFARLHSLTWLCMPPTATLSLILLLAYFAYRFHCLLNAQKLLIEQPDGTVADGTQSVTLAWIFLALELASLAPNALPYFLRILAWRRPPDTKTCAIGPDFPTVDILITCCNEDIDVILDTVKATCVLDYPRDRFRIFLCDDGGSDALRIAIEALNSTYENLFYTRRVKGRVKDYKAGNLNHGLRYSRSVPIPGYCDAFDGPQCLQAAVLRSDKSEASSRCTTITSEKALHSHVYSCRPRAGEKSQECSPAMSKVWSVMDTDSVVSEYVAGLDADMIPDPGWLKTILPYMTGDRSMALACPPQTFYDVPESDPLTQTMLHFAWITEIINDALGHADCLGSGYVMRRSAIEGIGGFPTESLSEDVCCSTTLLAAGWKTCFVPKTVQHGSVPESFVAHVKQRTRWFVGHVQTALLFRYRITGHRCGQLTLKQRVTGLVWDLRQLIQVLAALNFIWIPLALLSGSPLVIWSNMEELKYLVRLVTIWTICNWVHQFFVGLVAAVGSGYYDIRMPSYDRELEQWMAPYIFAAFFRSFILPERLGGAKAGFTSSGSIRDDLHERDRETRAPFPRRLYFLLFNNWIITHVVLVVLCLTGVGLAFARCFASEQVDSLYQLHPLNSFTDKATYLITRIGWPPLMWLQYSTSACSPIFYMLVPPTTPSREKVLQRDPITGVAYPVHVGHSRRWTKWTVWRYSTAFVRIVYTGLLLLFSWSL